MIHASKLIRGLRLPADAITAEELARAAWPEAVGKKVAGHTRAARMVRTRLIVEVEDRVWQRQLFSLSRQILANLEKQIGPGVVEDLEFRVFSGLPERRGPQRAVSSVAAPSDDADSIGDPVLRGIYKASRRRAGA
jgi:predicted nucleic acid-binding Zn ribbon protein